MTGRPSSSRGCWTCRWTQCRASPPSGTTRRASGSEDAAPCRRVCLLQSSKGFVGLSLSTSDRPVVPACCHLVINARVSNQPVLVCRLFTLACVQTTKACRSSMMVAYLILQLVLKSNQSCISRLYDEDVQDEAFLLLLFFTGCQFIVSFFFKICIRSGPDPRKIHNLMQDAMNVKTKLCGMLFSILPYVDEIKSGALSQTLFFFKSACITYSLH